MESGLRKCVHNKASKMADGVWLEYIQNMLQIQLQEEGPLQ
jgi:hypothetical protein